MQGVYQHVQAVNKGNVVPMPESGSPDSVEWNAYTSQQFFQAIEELDPGIHYTPDLILSSVDDWPYSTNNVHNWVIEAAEQYLLEWGVWKTNMYRDPTDSKGNLDTSKSVIKWTMPANGKIILLGDWGTSCADAEALLKALLDECGTPPDCIIHLGDIYYSGSESECNTNFYDVIRTNLGYTGPVFTIPGNHEYYSFGDGYFSLIDKLNSNVPGSTSAVQAASYFCLKTSDQRWQFLGLDTGYCDSSNFETWHKPPAPDLKSSNDVAWAQYQMDNFTGQTIMLTHHQLFTRSAEYMYSDAFGKSCANPYLYSYFGKYLKNKISAWFWGHEHSFALFGNGLMGLNMGRLLGSSSYEEAKSDNPYAVNYPLIPYNGNNVLVAPNNYKNQHDSNQYYPHAGAILQMNGTSAPTITYYSFPSWDKDYDAPSKNFSLTKLVTETITNPTSLPTGLWQKNASKSYNTDYGPAGVLSGNTLYVAYQNKDDSSKIYFDNASYNNLKLTKGSPAAISSNIKTDQNPAMVDYQGTLVLVYKMLGSTDLYWCTYDTSNAVWTDQGRLEDATISSQNIQSNYGPALTVFNGKVYLLYLHDGDNATVRWMTYDGSRWVYHGSKTVDGSDLVSHNNVCPAVAANNDNLYIIACSSSGLKMIIGDTSDNWVSQGTIDNGGSNNLPGTTTGIAVCANSRFVEVFYVDSDHYICWAIYDLTGSSMWSGGIRTLVSPGNLPQTGHVPCIATGNDAILLYRGNSNHTLYYAGRKIYG